jgi:ubiquinone/menaquinone biosynthesis C-methylase UbiE
MTIEQAAALLQTPRIEWARPQAWCDLGCGEGTFTLALAALLATGSMIHAVDMDPHALAKIPARRNSVEIRKVVADLNSSSLRLPSVDGILMANSLHFIPEQTQFLQRLRTVSDRFLIVEYERSRRSIWNPYPVAFQKLRDLFYTIGVEYVEQVATRGSRFGGTIYCAFAEVRKP